ncbi:hypothetical protein [Pararhodobacter sp.]|uniref:hypothetical protein n=1 Tax=Pararhodobacter sp. TaxID=2127056 RepID=UPI002AFE4A0A|nr:hypothetical protein [Pararhodobacter sp.]
MHPMSPADELAMIRAQLNGLRTREQELRQDLIAAPVEGRDGRWSRADVVTRTVRVFDHRLLPQNLRDDPCYWRERAVVEVRCLPIQARGPARWDAPPTIRPVPDSGSRPVHM